MGAFDDSQAEYSVILCSQQKEEEPLADKDYDSLVLLENSLSQADGAVHSTPGLNQMECKCG